MRKGKQLTRYQKLMAGAEPQDQDSVLILEYIQMAKADGWSRLECVRDILEAGEPLHGYYIEWLCNAITGAQRNGAKLLEGLQLKPTAGNPEKIKWWDKPKFLWAAYLENLTDEGMETGAATKKAQDEWASLYGIEAPDAGSWNDWTAEYRKKVKELTGAFKKNNQQVIGALKSELSKYSTGQKRLPARTKRLKTR